MKYARLALLVPALLALAACSTSAIKPDQLAKVEKVAIIGVDIQQQKPVSGGDLLGAALKMNKSSEAIPQAGVPSEHVAGVYQDLAQKLTAKTGWKVMKLDDLRKHPAYVAFFKEKTEGMQNRPIINDRFVLYSAPNVIDTFAIMTTPQERLANLAKDLGVDTIVYAPITVELNNSSMLASLVGKGEFRPSAKLSVVAIDATSGEKIYWQQVEGPKVEKGARNVVGMAPEEQLNQLAREASALSMDQAIEKLSITR
ncbi:MAG: hypothetical protein AAB250_08510 [Bdellovibrionota bacterium]